VVAIAFLNQVVTDIIYFTNMKLKYSPGNYDSFLKRREERIKARQKQKELTCKEKVKLQQQIDKFKKQVGTPVRIKIRLFLDSVNAFGTG